MIKTITELSPFIYARILDKEQQRRERAEQGLRLLRAGLLALYVAVGLKITFDTGLAPWDWRFWIMFGPVFLLGERVLWAFSHRKQKQVEAVEHKVSVLPVTCLREQEPVLAEAA